MRRSEARAGFTLIEVLAALAVTAAFVAVALPFAGRLAARWWVGELAVETADGWMQAVARLGDDLSEAIPLSVPQGDRRMAAFGAGPDFVQFVRPALGQSPPAGIEAVRYEIQPSPAGNALIRRSGRFDAAGFFAGSSLGGPTTILDGPDRLRFAAFGDDHLPRQTWTGEETMPAGVQMSAVARRPGASPSLTVLLPIVARSVVTTPAVAADPAPPAAPDTPQPAAR